MTTSVYLLDFIFQEHLDRNQFFVIIHLHEIDCIIVIVDYSNFGETRVSRLIWVVFRADRCAVSACERLVEGGSASCRPAAVGRSMRSNCVNMQIIFSPMFFFFVLHLNDLVQLIF